MKRSIGASGYDGRLDFTRKTADVGVTCQEHPCVNVYVPIELYQCHVQQYHDNRCVQCGKNLVTENFLRLHLEEMHNPFNSGDGIRYRCFEEQCDEAFYSHQERVSHAVKSHQYPESFDFDIVQNGQLFS
ncbi:hypothetical protein HG536_0B02330 [Torulaspora globosa]|uniref:C2H2-type domain-containing protein n=1 Tax=Torulaspora globosa TaxID=48254 RepID=A0A7G3ZCY4_9SACH|nr:uncharacterized protein HG536_0B02330 [Torulaspora globosa]QLL31370.1 hypothetical protein HG536_0B02330 [Torulaspora globosa]